MATSRREFISKIGAAGGYSAAYVALQSLGFISTTQAHARPALAPGAGKGVKVVILGAGMAGLASAYELGKAGYDCTILEARDRVGGRAWAVKRGTAIDMNDGSRQVCDFDEGQYFNAGPARLPSHHQAILGYCRELGVELEVEVNTSRGALLLNPDANGGKPLPLRRVANDARGHVSELLAKAINKGALDSDLTPRDKERMVEFLRRYGDLSPDLFYKGSERSGMKTLPGAGDELTSIHDPLDMSLLLDVDMWNGVLFEESFDMQATMFQPKGGMDQIAKALDRALAPGVVKRRCEVAHLAKTERGVAVSYRNLAEGKDERIEADYCICTIPLTVLRKISCDFSPSYSAAIARAVYGDSIKIAWQAPRFWEQEDHIYGGISWVKGASALVWYPSYGMHSDKGVVLGAYASTPELAAMTRAGQIDYTRKMIDQLHPGRGELLEKPMQIQWSKAPYTLGPWVQWKSADDPDYRLLGQPDGPVYFAGEHLSHVGAWQEGAVRSAHRTVAMIDARHRQGRADLAAA